MSAFKSDFLNTLSERGFIHQISDEVGLDELFSKEIVTAYIGFDATAKSLHAGSLIQIMMLHWMQKTGHRPIALMGGGTSMIGDPSFKDEARKLLTAADIEENLAGIRRNFSNYIAFGDGPRDALMANNADWLMSINYVSFLRDVGRHFSVNRMLSFDSVKLRLDREQSLSFLEFNYMILQAYDFVELSKRYGCRLQMGGSDQWGNIVNGIDLGHRMGTPQLFALTTPLLTTSSGAKMGKTASGAVWLDPETAQPLRFLAVLAQHRGCRCRPLPEALHHAAHGRSGEAGKPRRLGDQRGEESAGDRDQRLCCTDGRRRSRPRRRRARLSRKARWPIHCPP